MQQFILRIDKNDYTFKKKKKKKIFVKTQHNIELGTFLVDVSILGENNTKMD